MKINAKFLLAAVTIMILTGLSSPVYALAKPPTMDDMWKIIQAQQKQIDEMKTAMAQAANKAKPVEEKNTQVAEVKNTQTSEVKKLEHKTDVLSKEVEKLRTNLAIPEEAQYKSAYGLGPAASKVYQVGKGLSIGGYGEANYQNFVSDKGTAKDNADFERLVMYLGYKFTDKILFNSEIEFEHGSTEKGGVVSVEFAALDFFLDPKANIRAGMVLLPMGFINPIHEPPFYFGNNRPEVERRIIPTTWRDIGVGLFGELLPNLTYTTYVMNGLNAAGFDSNGIRNGRQQGSAAKAEDLVFVGRLDYAPPMLTGLTFGGSAYVGNSGQDQSYVNLKTKAVQKADAFTQLYEAHIQWKYRGLEFRTLGAWGHINDADILSAAKGQTIGKSNYGWYTEAGYDILPLIFPNTDQYLAPFFRYEHYNTLASIPSGFANDPTKNQQIYQFGLQYKPIPNVVIKADYRNFTAKQGTLPDEFNLGFGFIF